MLVVMFSHGCMESLFCFILLVIGIYLMYFQFKICLLLRFSLSFLISFFFFFSFVQISVLADDILKNVEFDALRIVFNKFHSVVAFIPTVSTILSPEVI